MRKRMLLVAIVALVAASLAPAAANATGYGGLSLGAPAYYTHFNDVWDLTAGDLTLSYTLNLSGISGPAWNIWVEVGLRTEGAGDFNPGPWATYQGACGGWMASGVGEIEAPDNSLDMDDKHNLQASGGRGETDYDVLSPFTSVVAPFGSGNNFGIWFDRDGVDPWQDCDPNTPGNNPAVPWGCAYGSGWYNTGGTYNIVIDYHAVNDGLGTMHATVNGVPTAFYTAYGNPPTGLVGPPTGLSFKGDMKHMQVFAGLWSSGASGAAVISNLTANGTPGVSDPLVADFSYSLPGGYAVQFTNSSHGGQPPYSYQWKFGDGGTSTAASPSHTYAGPGPYTIELQVSTGCLTRKVTKTVYLSHIIVDKVAIPADATQQFEFDPSWGPNFLLAHSTTPYDSGGLAPGTYSVAEIVPAGWTSSAVCVGQGPQGAPVAEQPGAISLQAGETVTCTFTNQGVGRIIVNKVTSPADATQQFEFHPSWGANFLLAGGGSRDSGLLPAGVYTVAEVLPLASGWSAGAVVCNDGSSPAAIGLSPGETVTCTFSNAYQQVEGPKGSLTIVKDATALVEPDDTGFRFQGSLDTFRLSDGGSRVFADLAAGAYTVSELVPGGWEVDRIECVAADFAASGPSVTVNLGEGEAAVCTFYNQEKEEVLGPNGSLTIVKETLPSGGEGFAFDAGDLGAFTLGDGGSEVFTELEPGAYTVTEAAAADWELSKIECTAADYAVDGAAVTVNLGEGEAAVCTFTNTGELPYTGGAEYLMPVLAAGLAALALGLGVWARAAKKGAKA